MLEARLKEAHILKRILDSLKDLVNEVNFDCSPSGISLQAMDSSHVSLVSLMLRQDGFDFFRCDKNLRIGINLANMAKILKCANNEDMVTLKVHFSFFYISSRKLTLLQAEDTPDSITFLFESQNGDKVSDFDLKLVEIDSEQLGIPDQEYMSTVKMVCCLLFMFKRWAYFAANIRVPEDL